MSRSENDPAWAFRSTPVALQPPPFDLRDYFAAAAIEAMGRWQSMHQGSYERIAEDAYKMADALLKERAK